MFEIYKKGQGKNTRLITFLAVILLGAIGAYILSRHLEGFGVYVKFGVPTAVLVLLALVMGWIVNRPGPADFMIATEGEMKKVSWSSRKEITGATKVVIVTTFILAGILFAVDMIFIKVFQALRISG